MLLGHWIEMRSISQAQGALKELAELLPNTAVRIIGDRTEEVAIDQLREQDVVLVRPGAGIPADGVVREGSSTVNESIITGESRPVDKRQRQRIIRSRGPASSCVARSPCRALRYIDPHTQQFDRVHENENVRP